MEENVAAYAQPGCQQTKEAKYDFRWKAAIDILPHDEDQTRQKSARIAARGTRRKGLGTRRNGLNISIGPRAPSGAHGGLHYKIKIKKGPFAVVDCSTSS